jgi:putative transposase
MIKNGEMFLNDAGNIVREEWLKSAKIRSEIELDEFMVMPNHFHGIMFIRNMAQLPVGATHGRPFPCGPKSRSIGAIIGGFKSAVTRRINEQQNMRGMIIWQRNYFEHIIRNEDSLNKIRCYIRQNPLNWSLDKERDSLIKFVSSLNRPGDIEM